MTVSMLIAAFAAFGLVMAAMAVGVIFSNRRLQGSCGGLGTMCAMRWRALCASAVRLPARAGMPSRRRVEHCRQL